MLSKLIKYDIRSTWREFAGVYLSILLAVLILPPLFNNFQNEIVNAVAGFIAVSVIITAIVITIVTLFKIFNTNVFSKEGYLTMTLPVSSSQIVASKLLVSTMWIILTGIVSAIGICIFVLNMHAAPLSEIQDAFRQVMAILDTRGILAVVLMAIAMIVSTVKEVAKLFLACSVAHLKQLGKFKVPVGILSYFALSWIETLVVQAVVLVLSFVPGTAEYVRQIELMNDTGGFQQFIGLFNGIIGVSIVYAIMLTAAYAVCTVWILNRKLDLD